ncbi:MAG: GntR family transcriptional regulator [Muribaculaceae bacterium]|nr:GntR family transcriptional regulator [Muribaculaceae bacterium]
METGKYNKLKINRFSDYGIFLMDEDGDEVLLPNRYVTADMELGEERDFFVYNDSENRPVATTEIPKAVVGDTVLMRVKAVNAVGAFLDWGLEAKDLLVPFREQRVRMVAGRSYVVRVYLDEVTQRIVASAKLDRFIDDAKPQYIYRQKVDVLVVQRIEPGYRVIVDNRYWGIIYQNEIYCDVNIGEHHMGFVKHIRPDRKIDVTLCKIEKLRVDDIARNITDYLKEHDGTMTLNDKSEPDEIMRVFRCSKKDFKKALGLLYKQQKVTLTPQVRLTKRVNER